jgi:O-acetyl-ADP-ribose deacetylase (regulator of RNase III)
MQIFLCDINKPLIEAWEEAFEDVEDVTVIHGSIFDLKADALVSPANSFGFMDGGIDYLISKNLGWDIQQNLKEYIKTKTVGEILVGQAIAISTTSDSFPFVISAPTMRVPMILGADSVNVFLATKAVLYTMKECKLNSVAIPGMGTGVGKVPVKLCAWQMRKAYDYAKSNYFPSSWTDAQRSHQLLTVDESQVRDLQQ